MAGEAYPFVAIATGALSGAKAVRGFRLPFHCQVAFFRLSGAQKSAVEASSNRPHRIYKWLIEIAFLQETYGPGAPFFEIFP
jgi:hypothetical protein